MVFLLRPAFPVGHDGVLQGRNGTAKLGSVGICGMTLATMGFGGRGIFSSGWR